MKIALLICILFFSLAQAGASSPSMEFSEREKEVHNNYVDQITDRAAKCLERTWGEHLAFYRKWGVSKFYGDRNPSLDTRAERIQALVSAGAPAALEPELKGTSCIGLTRECLKEGFFATKDQEAIALWGRIDRFVLDNNVGGIPLVNALQSLGWNVMYWNPDPSQNLAWDAEDVLNLKGQPVRFDSGVRDEQGRFIYHPGWGVHETRFRQVQRRSLYHTTKMNDTETLVNFGTRVPAGFASHRFFVGVAHAGYHVFPGLYGQVIEAHSMRRLDSIDNLENSVFNPLASGGGPRWTRSEKYRSGMIAVPPQKRR